MPAPASAHCPLCTAGAGLIAVGAYWIGVKAITIGVALGAFATAMGLWFGRLIKRKFVPHQTLLIAALSWLLTLVPIQMLFSDYASWYINWFGDYGSLFNRTYAVNLFWIGALVGTAVVVTAPRISRQLTKLRDGRHFPGQGMAVNLILIILVSLIIQLL